MGVAQVEESKSRATTSKVHIMLKRSKCYSDTLWRVINYVLIRLIDIALCSLYLFPTISIIMFLGHDTSKHPTLSRVVHWDVTDQLWAKFEKVRI